MLRCSKFLTLFLLLSPAMGFGWDMPDSDAEAFTSVAGELGINEITVKGQRGQVMQEMKANLVRIAEKLGLSLMTTEDSAARRSWFDAVVTSSGFQLPL